MTFVGRFTQFHESYACIFQNLFHFFFMLQNTLAGAYTSRSAGALRTARDQVNQMVSELAGRYSLLQAQQARLAACAGELDAVSAGYTSGLRAPSRGSYANYEDYVAAYNAYLASVTANASAEQTAARAEILTRYGFESESQLAQAAAQAEADLSAFEAAAAALEAAGDAVPAQLESARAGLLSALTAAETTGQLGEQARAGLARLVQLAAAQAESSLTTDGLLAPVDAALAQAGQPLMATFESLESQLPGGRVTSANAQQMKTLMSSEILQAVLRVNDLAQGGQPFAADDAAMQITDLHLKPLLALALPNSRGMALFCLFLAALMDGLTLLFSIACRRRRTLLGARSPRRVLAENGQALAAQICACLPAGRDPLDELDAFLSCFCASPATLGRGYNLAAPRQALAPYERLCALLCQLGLAAIEPAGGGEEGETVLLRADLLLFAGELLATRSRDRLAARLDGEAAARRSAKALGQPG